jgi:hypothetical protein
LLRRVQARCAVGKQDGMDQHRERVYGPSWTWARWCGRVAERFRYLAPLRACDLNADLSRNLQNSSVG